MASDMITLTKDEYALMWFGIGIFLTGNIACLIYITNPKK
jgi:hypothetical protein